MLKKVLCIIGGVTVLFLGYLLGGGGVHRRRVAGTKPDFDGIADAHDTAASGIDNAGTLIEDSGKQLEASQERVDGLLDSNSRSAALIARGRAILDGAKARNVGGGDT